MRLRMAAKRQPYVIPPCLDVDVRPAFLYPDAAATWPPDLGTSLPAAVPHNPTTLTKDKCPLRIQSQNGLSERLEAQQKAKQALLQKFKSRPGPDDPEFQKRQAERRAIAEARAAREAEKEAARRAEAERLAAEEAIRKEEERRLA